MPVSVEGLFPAVSMHSMGEEVKVDLQAEWPLEEDEGMMLVDSHGDDWGRLHDVRASGTVRVGPQGGHRLPVFSIPGEALPCVSGSQANAAWRSPCC